MKSSKQPGTTTITFTDSEVEQLKKSLKSFESDRALRVLGDQLLNLFASAEVEEVVEDEWIEFTGREQPLDDEVKVEVKLRDGWVDKGFADDYYWINDGRPRQIIAYRICK